MSEPCKICLALFISPRCDEKAEKGCDHKMELVGQRGPEVGIWRCKKCGEERS